MRQAISAITFYVGTPERNESERKTYSESLIKSLDRHKNKEVKAFLISQIQLIGKAEAVKPLGKYLKEEGLCEPASRAIVRIGGKEAARELVDVLDSVKGKNSIAIIRGLGSLKHKPAANDIVKYLNTEDRDLRLATLWALANIAEPSTGMYLADAMNTESGYEKTKADSYYLLFAKRLVEDGCNRQSTKICRNILERRTGSDQGNIRCSALSILVEAAGENAMDEVFEAMENPDPAMQARAMELVENIPGTSVTRKLLERLETAPLDTKLKLLTTLAKRGDTTALSGIMAGIRDKEEAVRMTAIDAAVILGQDEVVDDLLKILQKTEYPSDIKHIKNALLRIEGKKVMDKIADSLPDMDTIARVALIEVLAQRRVEKHINVILKQIESEDPIIRTGAFKALSKIGGQQALTAVVALKKSDNVDKRDTAVRTICEWQDAEAVEEILKIQAESDLLAYQVLATRRSVRLITQTDWPAAMKVSALRRAMDNAKRIDEKRTILAGLGSVRDLDALMYATILLEDKELNQEAALAVVKIACPQNSEDKGLVGRTISLILKRATPKIVDMEVRKRIEDHLKNMPKAESSNLALGKPVSISCRSQGNQKPEFAVDGEVSNKGNSYWGDRWPSWFQIDLEQTVKVDTVHIYFYWDGRYYQYDIELSEDGKNWKKVIDQSENTTAATATGVVHNFEPTNARYVRVNILKNSANEAVHIVECKVYAGGAGRVEKPSSAAAQGEPQAPEGFVSLFNGRDLTGWKGLLKGPYDNPIKRAELSQEKLVKLQEEADKYMRDHWFVEDGVLVFDGEGSSLATERRYGDFEMYADWKLLTANGDSGLYLRGSPQVQIWDPAYWKIGSGGLYNNQKNPSKPTCIADNPVGTWNAFYIKMVGEKVTVKLNDILIVDNVTLENYWDRNRPIFPLEQIELQCHGHPLGFRNISLREIPRPNNFTSMFNGKNLIGWIGDTKGYKVEDGMIVCKPGGNLYLEKQYSDFHFKFDFKLTTNANNGLGIRAELNKDAAYYGMELQILDNTGSDYTKLHPYQYHGSIYGIVPAKQGFLRPVGEWNHQEVIAKGPKIKVILNGTVIVDADIEQAVKEYKPGIMHDPKSHPGLMNKKGHIGFLGHGSIVYFRNIEIMELN
ncbi:MAG: DUF1080 domain-containing protein [Sedimentisphaerales bacterium]|nr:DUF1080 domain-containing protein [Sedimentisphaerales bacterium]